MLRISKQTEEKYQYALGIKDARLVKFLGFLGLVSTVFIVLGYLQFLYISPVLSLFFGPVLVVIALYHLIQYALMSLYPGFDAGRHRQKVADYWSVKKNVPAIAVFIPAAGESVDVVRETVRAAAQIDYPNYRVVILDDSKEGLYKELAREFGVSYLRRQDIGEGKKAGNMNYGISKLRGYAHVLVLDADFQARPEILKELVPYASDDIGIIQTPQHFPLDVDAHTRSKIEYGAAFIQRDFYRITQVARDRFGAAICVGTSALYNIEALNRVGGFEGVGKTNGWSHSEDVHTGLKMLNSYTPTDKQYRVIYLPIQLAKGTCPDDHHSFYKQQNRWATGSMQLFMSDKTVRSGRLSLAQRIIYGSNSLYYFYTMSLLLSPVYLLALALSSYPTSWAFTLYFLPSLAFKHIVEPYVMRREHTPLATSLVVLSNAYTFLQAAVLLVIRRPLGWEATGTKSTKKSRHFTYFKFVATVMFLGVYITTLGVLIMNEQFEIGPSMFVVGLFLSAFVTHIAFLFYTLIIGSKSKYIVADRKFYATLTLTVIIGAVIYQSYTYHHQYNIAFQDNRIQLLPQSGYDGSSDTIVDGYRRSFGDVKELLTR